MSDAPDWTIPTSIRAQEIETVKVDIAAQSVGNVDVNIASQSATLNVAGDVNVTNDQLNVNVTNAQLDVNITNTPVDINIAGQNADVNVNVTNSSINVTGSVDANITNSSLDVNVTNTQLDVNVGNQVDVNINAQSVDLNVKNDNYIEQRVVLQNNGDTPLFTNLVAYRVKYFTHRTRGIIRRIEIYARNNTDTDEDITVELCLSPRGPALYTYTLTIPANSGEGWHGIMVYAPWKYDTLAVRIRNQGNAEIAYDEDGPYDYYAHENNIKYIVPGNFRLWLRVYIYGSDSASLPVSGTVNAINLPNTSTIPTAINMGISPGDTGIALSVDGTGFARCVILRFKDVYSSYVYVRVYIDDDLVLYKSLKEILDALGATVTQGSSKISILKIDDTNYDYVLAFNDAFEFRRSLEVTVENTHDTDTLVIYAIAIISKLT